MIRLIVLSLALSACSAQKPPSVLKSQAKERPYRVPVEGEACEVVGVGWSSGTTDTIYDGKDVAWHAPLDQRWHCGSKDTELGKGVWYRDLSAEAKVRSERAVSERVSKAVTGRKLTREELPFLPEATNHMPDCRSGCSGDYNATVCQSEAARTGDLMAQLSFWHPTEQQLPLELLLSFTKGLRCDGDGARHTYQIINERIIAWLGAQ